MYQKYRYTATLKYNIIALVVTFVVLTIPILVAFLVRPLPTNPQSVTQCFGYFIWILIGEGVLLLIGLNYLLLRFLPLKDPYHIKLEFGVQFVWGALTFLTWMIIQIYDTVKGGMAFNHNFQPMYLMSLFCFNMSLCNLVYPVYLALMDTRKDYAIADMDRMSQEINIKTILNNKVLFAAFRETTVQYWCVETLLFVVAVERYRRVEEAERQAEAAKIIKTFLDDESQLYINVNHKEENEVREKAQRKEYRSNLFDGAYQDVLSQLDGILLRWKSTSEYRQVLAEANVRNSVDNQVKEANSNQLEMLQEIKLAGKIQKD